MPRPDVKALGVEYRRIPLMAIGRDIYNDTRLILRKLEQLFPASAAHPAISASSPEQKGLERLLDFWAIDGGIFTRAAQLIPSSMPLLKDPKFTADREQYTGRSWSKDAVESARPEALVDMKGAFGFLESTFLADGREWVMKTDGPSLADIEGMHVNARPHQQSDSNTSHSCMGIPLA
jgi:glutathione S-transferase